MKQPFAAALVSSVVMFSSMAGDPGRAQTGTSPAAPTFSRDVAPVLYANCVTCHRPGEAAPMSLLTYADARPWAGAIGRQVAEGIMPPWHADAAPGTFENERRLTSEEKDLVARWVAGGAQQGDPTDLPAPPSWAEGWRIGQPDSVFEMREEYAVPAKGTIEYEYFYIPTNFAETKWLQAIEVRPGNRALVHHVLVNYIAPVEGARGAQIFRPNREDSRVAPTPTPRIGTRPPQRLSGQKQLIATYAPGTNPQVFRSGTALRLVPGGTIELQLHYTANGTAGTDRTKVGMVFAKQPPTHEVRAGQFVNAQFTIPPGASDHEVRTDVEFLQDATLWGLFPHTHVRGKRWSYSLMLPNGTDQPLLSVPKYDFNWQTYYMFKEPIQIPKGARIVSTAWYDNSARNRSNPDPTMPVRWGDQTWEEMQYTGVLYSAR
jgi:mono/diheme cytochrome c family protein